METREEIPHPRLTLRFEPEGQTLAGDFGTGAPVTLISHEWLLRNGLIEAATLVATGMAGPALQMYQYAAVALSARLVDAETTTGVAMVNAQAVLDWDHSPFSSGTRLALIGRNILKAFGANVEIDGATGETHITTQNCQTFEAEVAHLFRIVGLQV